jgi:hypothetical protein
VLGLFHDLPEARTGDTPSVGRPYVRLVDPREVIADQAAGLPAQLGKHIVALVAEHESAREPNATLEAVCSRDADKVDCLLAARAYEAAGNTTMQPWIDSMVRAVTGCLASTRWPRSTTSPVTPCATLSLFCVRMAWWRPGGAARTRSACRCGSGRRLRSTPGCRPPRSGSSWTSARTCSRPWRCRPRVGVRSVQRQMPWCCVRWSEDRVWRRRVVR